MQGRLGVTRCGELSVLMCKSVTWEISSLSGFSTAELIRNDEDTEADPYQEYPTTTGPIHDEEQVFLTLTELIHGTEE